MATIRFEVNGQQCQAESETDRPLLDVLREDLGLTGTKYGCGEGQCRACTVLVEGQSRPSCVTPVIAVEGKRITTIEGLAPTGGLSRVQRAFVDADAAQCGYCTPGMILEATALLARNLEPSREQIIEAMNPHLCRCCGYGNILAAVERAASAGEGENA